MVVFVDHDEENIDDHDALSRVAALKGALPIYHLNSTDSSNTVSPSLSRPSSSYSANPLSHGSSEVFPTPPSSVPSADPYHQNQQEPGLPNLNADHKLAAILNCYPIVIEIARSVDLNTLHALYSTCREVRATLMPLRSLLCKETLKCESERLAADAQDSHADVETVRRMKRLGRDNSSRGRCVRDMVKECTRCGSMVCRNCIGKPYTSAKPRCRRLCPKCLSAPILEHAGKATNPFLNFVSPGTDRPHQARPEIVPDSAFCRCEEEAWLCVSCTRAQHNEDMIYRGGWNWRSKYSALFAPGLWAGIGEGSEGVKCGRGPTCLAAQETEVEVDCEADNGASEDTAAAAVAPAGEQPAIHNTHHYNGEPGYFRQQIIGVGGTFRSKAKKRVLIGAIVEEYPEERDSGEYLTREVSGYNRSWCGWCSKVIPSKEDKVELEKMAA